MTLLPVNMTAVRAGTDPQVHSWTVRLNTVEGYEEHRRPGRVPYRVGSDPEPPPPPPPPPPPLVADMSASPASPTPGQTVTLTAVVTGGTTPYSYAFTQLTGTAVTLAGTGATRTFTATTGLKTFQLVVTDSLGVTDPATAVVSVGSTLTASLARSPASPTVGQTVTLTATPAGGTGPYTYVFSQTSGTTVTLSGSGTGRTFTMPTTTTDLAFRVVVTDSVAATANATVTVARALTAALTSTPAAPVAGGTVTLTASAVGGAPAYSYVFSQVSGQSVSMSGSGATRTFTAPATAATLVLRVTVTDSQGTVSTADRTVTVISPPPPPPPPPPLVADMSASPADPTVGQTVTLAAIVTGGTPPYGYAFSQLTGTAVTLAGSGSSRTFTATAGLKTFQLVVTDSLGVTDPATAVVSVGSTLTATLARSPASPTVGATVTLTATPAGGSPAYTYVFSQTAGTTAALSGSGTTRTFTMPTTTTDLAFRVVVTDSVSATANATVTVARSLLASLTSSPAAPVAGGTVTLTASAVGGAPAYSYVFSQVSGQAVTLVGSGTTRSFTMPSTGAAPVLRVTVTDSQGTVSTADRTVTATFAAGLTANPTSTLISRPVTLTATATGGVSPYTYVFAQTSGPTVTLAGTGTTRTFTTPTSAATLAFRVTVTDSASGSQIATTSVVVSLAPPTGVMWMGCSNSPNSHGGTEVWDGWRVYNASAMTSLANRTGTQRPLFLAYSKNGDNLGGANPNYTTVYNEVLADLNTFYYNGTGNTQSARWSIKLYWSNGNENSDKGALTLPHTQAKIDAYVVSQRALYDAVHLAVGGVRRFPNAYAGSNPTQNQEQNSEVQDWLHPSARYHDFVMWSMYPPGRKTTGPDPTYNWPSFVESQRTNLQNGFLIRCFYRTQQAQLAARAATGDSGFSLSISCGEVGIGDDPGDSTTRPYYAVHGLAAGMQTLSNQYGIPMPFTCWWDNQSAEPENILDDEPTGTNPSTRQAWQNWRTYNHQYGGTHPASWAGNPKPGWKTTGTVV